MNVHGLTSIEQNVHGCADPIIQNLSERGRTYGSAHMHCIVMNAYRAECVTELGPNNSEPERARAHLCERIYARTGHISKTKADIEKNPRVKSA